MADELWNCREVGRRKTYTNAPTRSEYGECLPTKGSRFSLSHVPESAFPPMLDVEVKPQPIRGLRSSIPLVFDAKETLEKKEPGTLSARSRCTLSGLFYSGPGRYMLRIRQGGAGESEFSHTAVRAGTQRFSHSLPGRCRSPEISVYEIGSKVAKPGRSARK